MIKSKYTMIMLREVNRNGSSRRQKYNPNIEGTVKDSEWFLGRKKAGRQRFTQQVLNVALKEIEVNTIITSELNTMKYNQRVIGYQILVTVIKLNKVYFYQTNRLVYDIITFKFYTLIQSMSNFLTNIPFLVEVVKDVC